MYPSQVLDSDNNVRQPRLSEPPPDITLPLKIVSRSLNTTEDNTQANKPQFHLSELPPDVILPANIVSKKNLEPLAEQSMVKTAGVDSSGHLSLKSIDYQSLISSEVNVSLETSSEKTEVLLDFQEMYQIIREVAISDSAGDAYAAVSANREFMTSDQPAYQKRQFGLGFGLVLFTQASGLLGKLLTIMQRRNSEQFGQVFGTNEVELLKVTNAATEEERLQPVGGELLWSERWTKRFKVSGEIATFQAAQNETAIEHLFRPMLPIAHNLGLVSDRALAMVFDRVVTKGLGGGLGWVIQFAGPLRSQQQWTNALNLLSFQDLLSFQQSVEWIPKADQNGQFNLVTHAALVGALRERGAVFLSTNEMMDKLLAAAEGTAKQRLDRLRHSDQFEDIVYRLN